MTKMLDYAIYNYTAALNIALHLSAIFKIALGQSDPYSMSAIFNLYYHQQPNHILLNYKESS